ncbi:MAG: hypothetical protein LVR00_08195 [Rhabdochlamydiaceae bacterium]
MLSFPLTIFAGPAKYDVALQKLMEGNQKYANQAPTHSHDLEEKERRRLSSRCLLL